jgi:hypothetical protein
MSARTAVWDTKGRKSLLRHRQVGLYTAVREARDSNGGCYETSRDVVMSFCCDIDFCFCSKTFDRMLLSSRQAPIGAGFHPRHSAFVLGCKPALRS